MPRCGWRLGAGLALLAGTLAGQAQLSGRVQLPAARRTPLPGAWAAAAAPPAAVYLAPQRLLTAAGRPSFQLNVTWNRFTPALLAVPAGAQVILANRGTVREPLELLRLRGQERFQQHCAICHGSNGEALTPVGSSMQPHALNLTSPGIQAWSEAHMAQVVWHGIPGSGMPQWQRVLRYRDLLNIVHYVKQLPAINRGTALPPASGPARRAAGWVSDRLGTLAPGETRTRNFPLPGIYPVDIASQPGEPAYIVVAPSPYCTITDVAGRYRLPPAPPGHYQLVVWQPGSPAIVRNLVLQANTNLSLNLH